MANIIMARQDYTQDEILKAINFQAYNGTIYQEITYNADELPTQIDLYTDSTKSTQIGTITITYDANYLPIQMDYTLNGKTITQTFTYDANDNPTVINQTEV